MSRRQRWKPRSRALGNMCRARWQAAACSSRSRTIQIAGPIGWDRIFMTCRWASRGPCRRCATIEAELARTNSLIRTIKALRRPGRSRREFELPELAGTKLLDPRVRRKCSNLWRATLTCLTVYAIMMAGTPTVYPLHDPAIISPHIFQPCVPLSSRITVFAEPATWNVTLLPGRPRRTKAVAR